MTDEEKTAVLRYLAVIQLETFDLANGNYTDREESVKRVNKALKRILGVVNAK